MEANQPSAPKPPGVCPECLARREALRDGRREEPPPGRPPLQDFPAAGTRAGLAYCHV